jgi:hypothetical protein
MGDEPDLALLTRLEVEERGISARRRRLHDRIDFARQAAAGGIATTDLGSMLEEERAISAERRALHARIDELRVKLGREPGPPHKASLLS